MGHKGPVLRPPGSNPNTIQFNSIQFNGALVERHWRGINWSTRGKSLFQGNYSYHKYVRDWHVIEARPPRRKRDDWPPESRYGQLVWQPMKNFQQNYQYSTEFRGVGQPPENSSRTVPLCFVVFSLYILTSTITKIQQQFFIRIILQYDADAGIA